VSDGFEAALARLNVATAADMDALAQQVAELGAKIDQLSP
jgi:outer membrane murein-binding lipoprotein Lpp